MYYPDFTPALTECSTPPATRHDTSPTQLLPPLSTRYSNPNPRKHGPSVLDEDSYVAAIEKIIEHDFFCDIHKLRDRLDWLEAVRSGDPVLIRNIELKIIEWRSKNPNPNKMPSDIENRIWNITRTPAFSVTPSTRNSTSEDNESFSKIMEVNLRRKEYAHLLEADKQDPVGSRSIGKEREEG